MKHVWFKRKTYGWGWQPSSWEGWAVSLAFLAIIAIHGFMINAYIAQLATLGIFLWSLGLVSIATILIVICYSFGEKPHWQWGNKKK